MNNSVNLQHMKLVSGYLNAENNPAPGVPLSSPSGSIVQPYFGMVGGKMFIDGVEALRLSKSSIGTLYGGVYQMVLFKEAVIRGQVVYWDEAVNASLYQVTTNEDAVGVGTAAGNNKAGVALCTVSAGYYGFIQISGQASFKFAAVLSGAGAIGSQVYLAALNDDLGTADVINDNVSNPTWNDVAEMQAHYIGTAVTAPAAGAVSLVNIADFAFQNRQ